MYPQPRNFADTTVFLLSDKGFKTGIKFKEVEIIFKEENRKMCSDHNSVLIRFLRNPLIQYNISRCAYAASFCIFFLPGTAVNWERCWFGCKKWGQSNSLVLGRTLRSYQCCGYLDICRYNTTNRILTFPMWSWLHTLHILTASFLQPHCILSMKTSRIP